MSEQTKLAVVRLGSNAIRELLQLPEEAELLRVVHDSGMRDGGVTMVFSGVGQVVERGEPLPPADAGVIIRTFTDDGRELAHKIEWPWLR